MKISNTLNLLIIRVRQIMTKSLTDLQKKLVALTRDLILIPSDESRPDDIERCFEFIINHLE